MVDNNDICFFDGLRVHFVIITIMCYLRTSHIDGR